MTSKSVLGVNLSRRRLALVAGGAVAALLVGYLAGQLLIPTHNLPVPATTPSQGVTGATTTPATGTTAPAVGPTSSTGAPNSHAPLTAFNDAAGGFHMSYPQGWVRLSSKDTGVRLLASGPGGASLLVRRATLGVSISGRTLDEIEALTGTKLKAEAGVEIVAGPKLLSINNLPGFLYIYSFTDPAAHQRAAHSQITLFSGKRMYTLVYQTATASALVRLAPLFDQVTDTFHAN